MKQVPSICGSAVKDVIKAPQMHHDKQLSLQWLSNFQRMVTIHNDAPFHAILLSNV